MQDIENSTTTTAKRRVPWNNRPKHVWAIRTMLQNARQARDLALFNLAIDSKLRGCDVVAVKVDDVAPNGYAVDRATVRQRKTGRPVRFELTEHTRHSIDAYIRLAGKKSGEFLFIGRRPGSSMTAGQYARHLADWLTGIDLDSHLYGTHSLRRTKATLIYRRTGRIGHLLMLWTAPTLRHRLCQGWLREANHNEGSRP
jgi:integrase